MSSGGSDVEWGNGQPGNERFDPNYGTAQQAPTTYLSGGPVFGGSFTSGEAPSYSAGGFSPSGGGYNYENNNPSQSGVSPGVGGGLPGGGTFDTGGLPSLGGIDFSYLNTPGVESFGGEVPGYGMTDLGAGGTNVLSGTGGVQSSPGSGISDLGGGVPTDLSSTNRGAAPAAAKPSGEGGILESLGIKNPLGAAIGAGGLAYAMSQGQQTPKFSPEMEAAARNLDANGRQLMSYLQGGNLPPGLKAGLDQATAAAKAKVISNHAAQGLNTDPTQNTALAQQLKSIDDQALISTATIGQQLMQSGVTQSGLASDLYKTLSNIDQTQTANIGRAIANFAASLSGGRTGGGINLKVA